MKRSGFVAQAFEPAGSGDFPVARSWSTGLESPVNPQAGKPALQAGSWRAPFRFFACIGTMNPRCVTCSTFVIRISGLSRTQRDAAVSPSRLTGSLDYFHRGKAETGRRSVFSAAKNHVDEVFSRGEQRVDVRLGEGWVAGHIAVEEVALHLALPEFHQEHSFGPVHPDFIIALRMWRGAGAGDGSQRAAFQFYVECVIHVHCGVGVVESGKDLDRVLFG